LLYHTHIIICYSQRCHILYSVPIATGMVMCSYQSINRDRTDGYYTG